MTDQLRRARFLAQMRLRPNGGPSRTPPREDADEPEVHWDQVQELRDTCKAAGIEGVGHIAPPTGWRTPFYIGLSFLAMRLRENRGSKLEIRQLSDLHGALQIALQVQAPGGGPAPTDLVDDVRQVEIWLHAVTLRRCMLTGDAGRQHGDLDPLPLSEEAIDLRRSLTDRAFKKAIYPPRRSMGNH